MRVAVCIVSYRTPGDVAACVAALDRSTHTDFEVVVCENGGAAAFRELTGVMPAALSAGQPVRAIEAPGNLGYAGGVNLCMAAAPNVEAWWVLNPDAQPQPGAMAAMANRLAQGDCQAVGGPVRLADGRIQSFGGRWRSWLARAVSIGHGSYATRPPEPATIEARQNYLNGASMLIGRRFLDRVGPMREDYFLYCEEVEWCLRGLRQGMRLGFAPGGVVDHDQGSSTGNAVSLRDRSRLSVHLNERNRLLLTRDLFPLKLPVAAVAALMILALRYLRGRAWRQFGFALQGWRAGILNKRGPDLG